MVWFKHLALLLVAALPHITALPVNGVNNINDVNDVKDNSISAEGRYIVTLQDNIPMPEVRNHMSRVAAIQYRNSGNHKFPHTGIEKSYAIGEFHAYVGAFDLDTLQMIRNDTRVSRITPATRIISDTKETFAGCGNRARHSRQHSQRDFIQGGISAQRTLGPRNIVQQETQHWNLPLRYERRQRNLCLRFGHWHQHRPH